MRPNLQSARAAVKDFLPNGYVSFFWELLLMEEQFRSPDGLIENWSLKICHLSSKGTSRTRPGFFNGK
jgi:hypothetical protein